MDVQIIYREYIKPSSPTPLHLRTYKLCLLDQFFDHFYVPRVIYYNPPNLSVSMDIDFIVSKRLQILKQSLSETLTRFYPLAGEMKDNFSIDCNDKGIYFVEARAKSPLSKFLNQVDLTLISKFIPDQNNKKSGNIAGDYVAKIQVTTFECGGLVISACISHKFGDGTTFSLFLKSWAAVACKNFEQVICPNYDASSLFPPKYEYPREETMNAQSTRFIKTGRIVTRRFVFDAKAIANLKAKATSSYVQNPTRVEVVSALLSKCLMAAMRTKSGFHKPTLLTHAVNLRRKARPQISESCAGNIIWFANALCIKKEVELDVIVSQLREAITRRNVDFVKSLQGDEGFLSFRKAVKDDGEVYSSAADRIIFSSWCNFGFYNIDFGWGKPIWVSFYGSDESVTMSLNTTILVDTRLGDGIEAWLFLLEEDMALLELDEDLLAFATSNPSPLGQDWIVSHHLS